MADDKAKSEHQKETTEHEHLDFNLPSRLHIDVRDDNDLSELRKRQRQAQRTGQSVLQDAFGLNIAATIQRVGACISKVLFCLFLDILRGIYCKVFGIEEARQWSDKLLIGHTDAQHALEQVLMGIDDVGRGLNQTHYHTPHDQVITSFFDSVVLTLRLKHHERLTREGYSENIRKFMHVKMAYDTRSFNADHVVDTLNKHLARYPRLMNRSLKTLPVGYTALDCIDFAEQARIPGCTLFKPSQPRHEVGNTVATVIVKADCLGRVSYVDGQRVVRDFFENHSGTPHQQSTVLNVSEDDVLRLHRGEIRLVLQKGRAFVYRNMAPSEPGYDTLNMAIRPKPESLCPGAHSYSGAAVQNREELNVTSSSSDHDDLDDGRRPPLHTEVPQTTPLLNLSLALEQEILRRRQQEIHEPPSMDSSSSHLRFDTDEDFASSGNNSSPSSSTTSAPPHNSWSPGPSPNQSPSQSAPDLINDIRQSVNPGQYSAILHTLKSLGALERGIPEAVRDVGVILQRHHAELWRRFLDFVPAEVRAQQDEEGRLQEGVT